MESLIGKNYVASDNSYSVNLTYPTRVHKLAGTNVPLQNPIIAKIVSEPYQFKIRPTQSKIENIHWFINVEHQNDIIRVLYQERNVNADIKERIRSQERMIDDMNLFLQ